MSSNGIEYQDIHDICKEGDEESLKQLLSNQEEALSLVTQHNIEGMLPLHIAVLNAKAGCTAVLLEKGATQDLPFEGLLPIHLVFSLAPFEAFRQEATATLQVLLTHQANINARDRLGRTALHLAAAYNAKEAISLLIAADIDANLPDFTGRYAIHHAIEHRNAECLRLMISELGSDMLLLSDSNGDQPIHLAVRRGAWECFGVLLELGTEALLNLNNEREQTPEEIAEICGFREEYDKAKQGIEVATHVKGQTIVVTHELCKEHASLPPSLRELQKYVFAQRKYQAENPYRIYVLQEQHIASLLIDEFADNLLWVKEPPLANIADVLRVHEYSYYSTLKNKIKNAKEEGPEHLDRDTMISKESLDSALAAAGSVICAIDEVVTGRCKNAFCSVRPPGHHVGPYGAVSSEEDPGITSNGFCLLNNVAIGAGYARYNYKGTINRIAIIDFDVHHGNGTEMIVRNLEPSLVSTDLNSIFVKGKITAESYKPWLSEDDHENVLFVSSHAYGEDIGGKFYPASGLYESPPEMYPAGVLNIPLEYGTDSAKFRNGNF